jgi:N-acetylmuramoyl-L-alanine amidase
MSASPPTRLQSTRDHTIPLTLPLKPIAACLTLAILATPIVATAQQPTPRTVILIDPAHGGPDPGAHLPNNVVEKDLTLSFAIILRALLTASGVTVISTRDGDPAAVFTTDQRAEIANHAHPTACLILHATASGNGVHIVTSALTPDDTTDTDTRSPIPWETAQAASITQSLRLANELGVALLHAKLPVILSQASVAPLDNLTPPAVAIEIAPLGADDSDATAVTDPVYQQRIAQAIAAGVTSWRAHNAVPPAPAAGAPR